MFFVGDVNSPPGENGCLVGKVEGCFHSGEMQAAWMLLDKVDMPTQRYYHQDSDELIIVIKGAVELEENGARVRLVSNQYLFKTPGTAGRILSAEKGTILLVIKAPSLADCVIAE